MPAYNFIDGTVLPKHTDAQVIGERLNYLSKKGGFGGIHRLAPAVVVEDARTPQSPLHQVFADKGLWDDARAAEQARLQFAGYLVRHVHVEIISNGERKSTRAFVSITNKESKRKFYVPFAEAFSDEDMRAQLLASARAEYLSFKHKYEHLKELAELWEAGDVAFARAHKKAA